MAADRTAPESMGKGGPHHPYRNIITVADASVTPMKAGPVARPIRVTRSLAAPVTPLAGLNVAAYLAAVGLAAVAAWFSIQGMVVLFPGALRGGDGSRNGSRQAGDCGMARPSMAHDGFKEGHRLGRNYLAHASCDCHQCHSPPQAATSASCSDWLKFYLG
jgi:hypothetical protein